MSKLKIPVQYFRLATDPEIECVESKFDYIHKELMLDVGETAIVIVDPWNTHYIASYIKRSTEVTRTKIAPALEAARKCGMKVIYAPGGHIAIKHPQWTRFAGDQELNPIPSTAPDWPPLEFREKTGKYAEFFASYYKEPVPNKWWKEYSDKIDISDVIWPKPEDFVVATGNQLHRLLRYCKILHLFYCGFAANACLPYNDYGMRPFAIRGYNLILLRDATTGIEGHDTINDFLATKMAIREIEMFSGFSSTTEDFVEACNSAI